MNRSNSSEVAAGVDTVVFHRYKSVPGFCRDVNDWSRQTMFHNVTSHVLRFEKTGAIMLVPKELVHAIFAVRGRCRFGCRPSRLSQDRRHLEPDSAEQAALADIRNLRREGRTLRGIAAKLNDRGHRTRRGSEWRLESEVRIMKQASLASCLSFCVPSRSRRGVPCGVG
jgi:hypothetical protein